MANCKDEIKRITKDLVDKYVKGLCDKIKKMNTLNFLMIIHLILMD